MSKVQNQALSNNLILNGCINNHISFVTCMEKLIHIHMGVFLVYPIRKFIARSQEEMKHLHGDTIVAHTQHLTSLLQFDSTILSYHQSLCSEQTLSA